MYPGVAQTRGDARSERERERRLLLQGRDLLDKMFVADGAPYLRTCQPDTIYLSSKTDAAFPALLLYCCTQNCFP